ncbi:MAG: hypothetical protein GC206_00120 [Alphaproteobacteria bacterium]|nr:hypothetical protein [Alphaproteobacteria bacterium]
MAPVSLSDLSSDLWSAAIDRLSWLRGLFGSPFAFLRQRGALSRDERNDVLAHLRPLERLVRATLMLMALADQGPPRPASVPKRRPRRTIAAPRWPGEDSSAWRGVAFRVLASPARPRRRAVRAAPATIFHRYPLAKRMEAIARVLARPERWIARLAQTFRTRTTSASRARAALGRYGPHAPGAIAAAAALIDAARRDTG